MDELESVRRKAEAARAAADEADKAAVTAMAAALAAMKIAVETYDLGTFAKAEAAESAARDAVRRHARLEVLASRLAHEVSEMEISDMERRAESAWIRAAETPFDLGEW